MQKPPRGWRLGPVPGWSERSAGWKHLERDCSGGGQTQTERVGKAPSGWSSGSFWKVKESEKSLALVVAATSMS